MVEWEALYLHLEPLPEDRADLRMGITVANGLAPYMKKGATCRPRDFIPRWGEPKKPTQTREQMAAVMKTAMAAMNPKPKRDG